ncbi:hypothetical protein [Salipaludibacillus sp. CF4.18]|uniref:hypothetical protein n=1 Tax=Salipaludibacillus sp. CF4.18 TaxID=3373081 RepID=UPI003EE44244
MFTTHMEMNLEEGIHEIGIEQIYREVISSYFVVAHVQNQTAVTILERMTDRFKVLVEGGATEVVFQIVGNRIGYEDIYMEESTGPDSDEYEEEIA